MLYATNRTCGGGADKGRYENAQKAFTRNKFPTPALVFTVLLSSDARMAPIHGYHRAVYLNGTVGELRAHVDKLEEDLTKRTSLLDALEIKLESCQLANDVLGIAFWGDRVQDKRLAVQEIAADLAACKRDLLAMSQELNDETRFPAGGISLKQYAETEGDHQAILEQQTLDELAAWDIENGVDNGFPPLESVLGATGGPFGPCGRGHRHGMSRFGPNLAFPHRGPGPFGRHGQWRGHPHWTHPHGHAHPHAHHHAHHFGQPGSFVPNASQSEESAARSDAPVEQEQERRPEGNEIRNLFDRIAEMVSNRSAANLVPTQELKNMLDGFLNNMSNQLADTFDGAAADIRKHTQPTSPVTPGAPMQHEQTMPGAFETVQPTVSPATTPAQDVQTQTVEERVTKPRDRLGKGGYRHKHIACDGCLSGIRGMRYKCEQCPDYDLCGSCLPLLHTSDLHPSTHTFKAMLHRGLEDRVKISSSTVVQQEAARHPASCDMCQQTIIGVRWKCLNCPDWDCCDACSTGITSAHPGHSFVKISKASDFVDKTSGLAIHHPHILCDGCDQSIKGTRYKCLHPSCADYDLCEHCEAAPAPKHPADHPMLKIKQPLRVECRASFEPVPTAVSIPARSTSHAMATRKAAVPRAPSFISSSPPTSPRSFRKERLVSPKVTADDAAVEAALLNAPAVPTQMPVEAEERKHLIELAVLTPAALEPQPEAPAIDVLQQVLNDSLKLADDCEKQDKDTEQLPRKVSSATTIGAAEAVTPLDIFSWVRHVTISPGCTLPAGTEFTKTWRVKHFASGAEYGFDTLRLVLQSGGGLGEACNAVVEFKRESIKDGEEVDVSLEGLKVPDTPGEEVVECWRFEDKDGIAYGQPLRLR